MGKFPDLDNRLISVLVCLLQEDRIWNEAMQGILFFYFFQTTRCNLIKGTLMPI